MLFEKIDRNSWKRNEYFEHYFANTPCTYSMTVKLDITPIKKKQLKLYPAMLYIKKLQDECFTQTCKNISAPNATVANVGKNKQISYRSCPARGLIRRSPPTSLTLKWARCRSTECPFPLTWRSTTANL